MEKYQWKESLGRKILEMYESVRPLEDREKDFSHFAWLIRRILEDSKSVFEPNKARIPEKSVEKLQTAIGQQAEKSGF